MAPKESFTPLLTGNFWGHFTGRCPDYLYTLASSSSASTSST
jgi:hypothetical protein